MGTIWAVSRRIHDFVFQSRQPLVGLELKKNDQRIGTPSANDAHLDKPASWASFASNVPLSTIHFFKIAFIDLPGWVEYASSTHLVELLYVLAFLNYLFDLGFIV